MKTYSFFIKIIILFLFISDISFSVEKNFFEQGKKHFDKNDFNKSKFYFEKDIVFNPKSEKSYLYLAKIFEKDENFQEQETNLNNVLILNPNNDEAIYMLILLKIEQSDYNEAKKLIEKFDLVCESFCLKKSEIDNMFNKLIPDNEKKQN